MEKHPVGAANHDRGDQSRSHDEREGQERLGGIARRAAHQVIFVGFEDEHQTEEHGGHHVDPEQLHRQHRESQSEEDRQQNDAALAEVRRQRPNDELAEIVKDPAPLLNGGGDGGKIVVGQDHRGGAFGHVGAGDAHGHTDVGLL